MRETWMDALRGIAIILVVILHAGIALSFFADGYPVPIRVFNKVFEPYRMPTLIFLSGMLLDKSLRKPAAEYLSGKARTVAWPYAVWTVIALALSNDLTLYALGRAVYNPVETHLWYLWFLIIFYLAARLLRRIPPEVLAAATLVLAVFMPADFRLDKMTFLFSFFMLGAFFSQRRALFERWIQTPQVLIVSGLLAALASGLNVAGVTVLYEPLLAVCVVAALALALRAVPLIPTGRIRGALEYLGLNSIVLYIVHLLAIKIVGTLFRRLVVQEARSAPGSLADVPGVAYSWLRVEHNSYAVGRANPGLPVAIRVAANSLARQDRLAMPGSPFSRRDVRIGRLTAGPAQCARGWTSASLPFSDKSPVPVPLTGVGQTLPTSDHGVAFERSPRPLIDYAGSPGTTRESQRCRASVPRRGVQA